MSIETRLAELVTKKEEAGGYEILVFEDKTNGEFIMCTKLPNWNSYIPELYEIGYLQVREFIAGEDKWYDMNTGENIPYKYTAIYFWNFIPKKEEVKEYKLD